MEPMRAVRQFTEQPIHSGQIEGWIEAARRCGSSRNSQPWRFAVVRRAETLRVLATLGEHTAFLATAPLAVVIAGVPGPYPFSTIFDLGRVSELLMQAAWRDGVASCPAVFEPSANIDRAKDVMGVPAWVRLDLAIGFGYPKSRPRAPARAPASGRLRIEVVRSFERFTGGQFDQSSAITSS